MKINKISSDKFAYIMFCMATFGLVALVRVTISEAIRLALKE